MTARFCSKTKNYASSAYVSRRGRNISDSKFRESNDSPEPKFQSCDSVSHRTSENFHPAPTETEPVTSSEGRDLANQKISTRNSQLDPFKLILHLPDHLRSKFCRELDQNNSDPPSPILSQLENLVARQRPNFKVGSKILETGKNRKSATSAHNFLGTENKNTSQQQTTTYLLQSWKGELAPQLLPRPLSCSLLLGLRVLVLKPLSCTQFHPTVDCFT